MRAQLILGLFVIFNLSFTYGISVGKFMKSYMNAPNTAVKKMLVQDMLGDINERSITDIFDNYDEEEEYEYDQMLRNRDFLRKEDREHLDNVLKYTKVANSKWGKILLHPEKIPNPASFLQWDMKKFIKRIMVNPELRRFILAKLVQSIDGSTLEKFRSLLKQHMGDKFQDINDHFNSLLMTMDATVDDNVRSSFQATDTEICVDSLEATWGFPIDILGHIIKLIGLQIIQTIFEEVDNICGILASLCQDFVPSVPDWQCALIDTYFPCNGIKEFILGIQIDPLKRQPTLIPTIAMIDATAKIPEGILELKLHWPGSYELCGNVFGEYNSSYTNQTEPFTGKYCRIDIGFAQTEDDGGSGDGEGSTGEEETPWGLPIGICIPDTCGGTAEGRQYIQDTLSEPLGILGLGVVHIFCGHEGGLEDNVEAQAALGVVVVILVIAVAATIWDGFFRKGWLAKRFGLSTSDYSAPASPTGDSFKVNGFAPNSNGISKYQESMKRISAISSTSEIVDAELTEPVEPAERAEAAFTGFSFYSNLRRIFTPQTPREDFSAIHFLRFFSLCYLMLGETYFLGTLFTEIWAVGNFLSWMMTLPRQWYFQPILNVHFSADTFFAISGFLACYWWLRRIEKNDGKLKWTHIVHYIVHKYLVLVIPMMLTLMFYATWYKFLLGGPLAPLKIDDAEFCKDNWWTNLLLVHNLVNRFQKCVSWTWYVACVFQLHVVTLICVLIPIVLGKYGRYFAYFMIFALWGVHVGINADYALDYYGLIAFITDIEAWYRDMLQLPWNRAGAYLVGTVFGIIMFKLRRKKIKIPWPIDMIGWLGSIAIIAAVTFSTYDMVKEEGSGPTMWSKERLVAWEVLSRSAWALCICWIIFSVHYGGGGCLSCLINWKVWLPLARLTYTSYLIHAVIISRIIYAQMSLVEITQDNMWYLFLGNLFFSLGAGIVIALIFYLPFVNMEAAIFYIKTKGAAMMYGRHPYEGLDMDDIDDIDDEVSNDFVPPRGTDNYAMEQPYGIYNSIRTSKTPSAYYNSAGEVIDSKPVHVTEL